MGGFAAYGVSRGFNFGSPGGWDDEPKKDGFIKRVIKVRKAYKTLKKLAKQKNQERTDALYERIQNGSCKVVEYNGKKYACEKNPDKSKYSEEYTIYSQQEDGTFNGDEYTKLSIKSQSGGVYIGGDAADYQDYEDKPLELRAPLSKGAWNGKSVDMYATISGTMQEHHKLSFKDKWMELNYFHIKSKDYFEKHVKPRFENGRIDKPKSIGFTEIKLPVDETTLPKEVAEYYGRIPESSQSSESLLKDRTSALIEFYKKLESSPSKDLFEIISRGCPEEFCAQAYAQYKEQVNAQERQSRITETKQRLSENKNKSQEQSAEQQSEVIQEQQQTNSVVQEVSNVETLAKQKAIKDRLQKE